LQVYRILMKKNKIDILLIHTTDVTGNKISGIDTFIKDFIKYLPASYNLELIGISSGRKKRPVGRWENLKLNGREFRFLPILYVKDVNKKTRIPLILLFTLALLRYKKRISLRNKILLFHRIEPTLLFKNQRNKKVVIIHGNMQELYNRKNEVKWSRLPFLYFSLEKYLLRRINKIYIVNENGVRFYKEKYPFIKDRIFFFPSWVDIEIFYPIDSNASSNEKKAFLKKLDFPIDSILILFVGRLEKQKDPFLLIDTFKYLNAKMPQTRLLIAGTGSLKNNLLIKIKKNNLQKRVFFHGPVSPKILSNIMKISDILLSTSAFEGMSRSILEALACGIPVVATDVGEADKIIRNSISGFISKDRNPETIGKLIIRVLKQKKNFKVENCVESIKNYTADVILGNFYREYEKL